MEKVKKSLIVEKSKYPDDKGKYVLWLYSKTKHGECWRGLFKWSKKDCMERKLNLIHETKSEASC